MKGQISLIEMITSAIILFITLTILFPSISYQDRWSEALILLKGRDLVLTIDRIEKLYNFSFDSESLKNFLNRTLNETNLIYWSETEGTLKHVINVACNCTQEQINNLSLWFSSIRVNNRTINLRFLSTYLNNLSEAGRSDVLLIWGTPEDQATNLTIYKQNLKNYISQGNGIVEIKDFYQYTGNKNSLDPDDVQKEIFGLNWSDSYKRSVNYDEFVRKPDNSSDIIFGPYKYFYHVPLPLRAFNTSVTIPNCPYEGNFTLNTTTYKFWICSDKSVWFDSDGNGVNDTLVNVGDRIKIGNYNFSLNYVDGNDKVGISFKPNYVFGDFLRYIFPSGLDQNKNPDPPGGGIYRLPDIIPSDGNGKRILIQAFGPNPPKNYSAVILNSSSMSNVAWIADFSKNGTTDDEKMLLLSLLFWASNKKAIGVLAPGIKIGYATSYLNSVNDDMFEIYTFKLGLGYPY